MQQKVNAAGLVLYGVMRQLGMMPGNSLTDSFSSGHALYDCLDAVHMDSYAPAVANLPVVLLLCM